MAAQDRPEQELLRFPLGFRPPKCQRGKNPWPKGAVRCPNEDTIATLLGSVDPENFNSCIALWVTRMLPAEVDAAGDGKVQRGTQEHILEVFVNDLRLVVWQAPVGEKQNELSTPEKHIAGIFAKYPQIKLLTGDTMFCHKAVARAVQTARRHSFSNSSPRTRPTWRSRGTHSRSSQRLPHSHGRRREGGESTAANW